MPPFDDTSALRGIDGHDVSSLRKLMNAIMHRLAGVPAGSVAEMDDLDINEHGAMIFLTENARHNILLSRMITRFASARYANSRTVREAARELDLVVTEAVFYPHTRPQRELVIAEGFFNQLVANGTATYGVGADEEYGDIEPDSDGEQKDKRDKKDPSIGRKRTRSSNAASKSNKRCRMGVSWSDDESVDEQESFLDDFKYECSDSDKSIKSETGNSNDPAKKKHKNSARRKHGERCLPDPTISRDNAVVGQPDLSKVSFTLQTERPDPNNPGSYLPSDPILFEYTQPIDWDDKTSIGKLNSWRYQVFKRTWGQKRESRPPWTINEQTKLLSLLDSHLKSPSTGGRYSRIQWQEIERSFNSFFQNHTHLKGEMTAETLYNQRGKENTAKSRMLVADRPHLQRSAGAIENQLTHFTDPAARALVAAAKQADQAEDEEDEKPKGKGNGKGRAKASAKKVKPAPKPNPETKVEKEEIEDDEYEGGEEDEDESFEDALIASKRG